MNVPKVLSRIRVGFINFSSYHGKTLKDRIFKSQIRGVESYYPEQIALHNILGLGFSTVKWRSYYLFLKE